MPSIEEMFSLIDSDPMDGRINLYEFKRFYDAVLASSRSKSGTAEASTRMISSHHSTSAGSI